MAKRGTRKDISDMERWYKKLDSYLCDERSRFAGAEKFNDFIEVLRKYMPDRDPNTPYNSIQVDSIDNYHMQHLQVFMDSLTDRCESVDQLKQLESALRHGLRQCRMKSNQSGGEAICFFCGIDTDSHSTLRCECHGRPPSLTNGLATSNRADALVNAIQSVPYVPATPSPSLGLPTPDVLHRDNPLANPFSTQLPQSTTPPLPPPETEPTNASRSIHQNGLNSSLGQHINGLGANSNNTTNAQIGDPSPTGATINWTNSSPIARIATPTNDVNLEDHEDSLDADAEEQASRTLHMVSNHRSSTPLRDDKPMDLAKDKLQINPPPFNFPDNGTQTEFKTIHSAHVSKLINHRNSKSFRSPMETSSYNIKMAESQSVINQTQSPMAPSQPVAKAPSAAATAASSQSQPIAVSQNSSVSSQTRGIKRKQTKRQKRT